MLCWNLTVNDRWSSLSSLGLRSSALCDTVSVTLITPVVSGSRTVNRAAALALEASCVPPSKRTHTHRPPPTQSRTHSNTQNKHADSTQHSTHCNNFRGMVSMWRGCGKRVGREVGTGEGRHCAAFNPQEVSDIPYSTQWDSECSVQVDGNLRVQGSLCSLSYNTDMWEMVILLG